MSSINNIKLRYKLIFTFLLISLLVIIAQGTVTLRSANQALEKESFNKLTAVREIKGSQIEDYFQYIRNQALTFSESRTVISAMNEFKKTFHSIPQEIKFHSSKEEEINKSLSLYYKKEFLPRLNANLNQRVGISQYLPKEPKVKLLQYLYLSSNPNGVGEKDNLLNTKDGSRYSQAHEKYHPIIRSYLQKFGYYDIFLVDADTGHLVYTVFKEVDYGTSLLTGAYKNTGFAKAFKYAKESNEKDFVKLIDFEPYHPSYNAAASFIASPIFDAGKKIGILIFQMPIDKINAIMTSKENWENVGLGSSGETYIVGDDFKLRNQSRFLIEDQESYLSMLKEVGTPTSVVNAIASSGNAIGLQEVKTRGTQEALKGSTSAEIFKDYRNIPVLSSYRPLKIKDVQWVIMSEIDEEEAFAQATKLMRQIIYIGFCLLLLIGVLAIVFSNFLTNPINRIIRRLTDIVQGEGDLTQRINISSSDEVGILGSLINQFIQKLHDIIQQCQYSARYMTDNTDKVQQTSSDLSAGASNQAAAIEESSTTIQVFSKDAQNSSDSANNANMLISGIKAKASDSEQAITLMVDSMENINTTSKEISNVINTIDSISFRTNLLAINASVEAARAGEQGRGFAVVAEEVRSLAQNSAEAARETTKMINDSLERVNVGMDVTHKISQIFKDIIKKIDQAATMMDDIAKSSRSQTDSIQEINSGIEQVSTVTQKNNEIASQNREVANELKGLANELHSQLSHFKTHNIAGQDNQKSTSVVTSSFKTPAVI